MENIIFKMIPFMSLFYRSLTILIVGLSILIVLVLILAHYVTIRKSRRKKLSSNTNVAFFHPYCNAGGGGERVLWCAVKALQKRYTNIDVTIYTGDVDATADAILKKACTTFNVAVSDTNVRFVYLRTRHWVEANKYPYFTLLGQSLGSLVLGVEALLRHQPDVYIDSMGYAFTLPLFRFLGGCRCGCYVHYPTISTDMLRRVKSRVFAHNNNSYVVKNPFLTWMKLVYYKLFAKVYSCVGRCSHTIMVNSTWTEDHILNLWDVPFKTHRVYPPCEVTHLKKLSHLGTADKRIVILSVGQFRPEKDHPLQLQAMYELRTLLQKDEALFDRVRLVIVGSCRHHDDYERMQNMKDLAKHLSLENSVEFKVNVSYQELIQLFQSATMGLHSMWNEHFGIGVVECMAAGLITIANRSGGPLMDIIETSDGSQTGYLAVDAEEYAKCFANVLYNTKEQNETIRKAARASVDRFSEAEFESAFLRATGPLFRDVI